LTGQRQLAEIIAGSPVATFVLDCDGRVTHWNRACEALTGVSATEMLTKSDIWRSFYPHQTRRVVLAELLVRGAGEAEISTAYAGRAQPSSLVPGAYEAREFFPAFGDKGKWLHFMAAPLHSVRGKVVGAIETLVELNLDCPEA